MANSWNTWVAGGTFAPNPRAGNSLSLNRKTKIIDSTKYMSYTNISLKATLRFKFALIIKWLLCTKLHFKRVLF